MTEEEVVEQSDGDDTRIVPSLRFYHHYFKKGFKYIYFVLKGGLTVKGLIK